MSISKSNIIKQLSNNYPNFLNKDLTKLVNIILLEIKSALKRGERIELRDILTIEPKLQKARISRNPKTDEKINVPEKKKLLIKISKEWSNKINEE
ncbi:MAG: integration host factor subunit beta [Candidatus Pelagibacter sp.]|nr:integration host factor subunit beta [Candidatus Pelagibacter sp.]